MPHENPVLLRVLAAVANRIHLARAAGISGQLPGHELQIGEDFVVVVGNGGGRGEHTPLTVRVQDKSFEVGVGGSVYRIQLQSSLRDLVVRGTCNGEPFCAQIERIGLAYRVIHNGTHIDAKVFTPRAAELNLIIQGLVVSSFVAENGVRRVSHRQNQWDMTVFPQEALHEEYNPDCTDAIFAASFVLFQK